MNYLINHFIKIFILFSLLFTLNSANASPFRAYTDRLQLLEGETFKLILETDQQNHHDSPDLSPLSKDFSILSTATSNQVSVINNQTTSKIQWILTLVPKQKGEIQIPSIHYGKFLSEPIRIEVLAQSQENLLKNPREIFMSVDISPKKPYVQSQIIYTIKLFYKNNLLGGNITPPNAPDTLHTQLGQDTQYMTHYQGQIYHVTERSYAFFPQKSGQITFDPPLFQGEKESQINHANGIDRFFSLSNGQPIQISADTIKVNIQAKPSDYTGKWWIPAIHLTLTDSFDEKMPVFQVGQPITRTLTLKAKGLSAEQLPSITDEKYTFANNYPDKPINNTSADGKSISGERIEKIALIPTEPGEFTLPAINIPWWNTELNRQEIASIPEKKIIIKAAVNNNKQHSSAFTTQQNTKEPPAQKKLSSFSIPYSTLWTVIFLLLLIIVVTLLIIIWRLKKLPACNRAPSSYHRTENIWRQLKTACFNNDIRQTKTYLLEWAAQQWPDKSFLSLVKLAEEFPNSPELQKALSNIDNQLYSQSEKSWDGRVFWELLLLSTKKLSKKNGNNKNYLPDFHKK